MADIVRFNPQQPNQVGHTWPHAQISDGYPDSAGEASGLPDYVAIVRRQVWLVLSVLAVAVGITLYFVLTAPPRYRAVAVVRLADTRRALTGSSEAAAYEQVLGRETDLLQSQMQVLTSRSVAGEAVDKEGLRLTPLAGQPYLPEVTAIAIDSTTGTDTLRVAFGENEVTIQSRRSEVRAPYGQPAEISGLLLKVATRPKASTAIFQVKSREAAIEELLASLHGTPRPKTDIIDLSFVASEPHYAQRVANVMALTFQARNATGAQQASRRRRIFLEQQMAQTDALLQKAMNQYSSFRSRKQVFSSKEKASAEQAGMVTVDMRRAELDAERRTYLALLSQTQRSRQGSEANLRALLAAPGIAANPVIQQLYSQLAGYETARDSMLTNGAAETNPDVHAMNTLISSTINKLIAAVRSQIQALDANIASLDNLRSQSAAAIASVPATETEEAQLAQQVQTIQKMSDQLQEEYQKARMSEAVEAGQVEIVDLADLPTTPIPAGRGRKLALGIMLGLLLGVGAAVIVDGMNRSIRRRDDIERVLQIPGLAVIPGFVTGAPIHRRAARALTRRARNGRRSNSSWPANLVTVHDAQSIGAEAFRTLRTNLIFSQAVRDLRTIVVTSASPGEGKTTTAANLAVSFAQQGMRVLLVDCDLRRAHLHKVFRVAREPGLTELVLGRAEQEAITHDTSVTGLYVIASGQLPPNPSEMLGGERMRKTLAKLTEAFDLIVLDTPPLLAASDAAILGTHADGVVLVVKAGFTESEAGQQAIQQLVNVGARVLGAVLNDPDSKLKSYGGYYEYAYAPANT